MFLNVIEKAACKNSDQDIPYHFVDINKTILMSKGRNKRNRRHYLTRYVCYLVAQNGDNKKERIAFTQSYFAIQTRKQDIIEKRIALIERLNARKNLSCKK